MKIRKSNKGFSLVEMMVAVTILSIVMLGVGYMLASMSKSFGLSQREVQLQDSVQTTYGVISDLVREAQSVNKGVEGKYKSVLVEANRVYIFAEEVDRAGSAGSIKVPINTAKLYIVDFDSANHKLYLYDKTYDPTTMMSGSASTGYTFNEATFNSTVKTGISDTEIRQPRYLLSNNVKSFTVVDRQESGYVVVSLELEYGTRTASITQNVYLRNSNIAVEMADDETDPDTDPDTDEDPDEEITPPIESSIEVDVNGIMESPSTEDINENKDISVNYESGSIYEVDESITTKTYEFTCAGHEYDMICGGSINKYQCDGTVYTDFKCKECGEALNLHDWDGKVGHNWSATCPNSGKDFSISDAEVVKTEVGKCGAELTAGQWEGKYHFTCSQSGCQYYKQDRTIDETSGITEANCAAQGIKLSVEQCGRQLQMYVHDYNKEIGVEKCNGQGCVYQNLSRKIGVGAVDASLCAAQNVILQDAGGTCGQILNVAGGDTNTISSCSNTKCQYYGRTRKVNLDGSIVASDAATVVATETGSSTGIVKVYRGNKGKISISNESLTDPATNVEVTFYFEDPNMYFVKNKNDDGDEEGYLTANALSSAAGKCQVYNSPADSNGRCRYLKVVIPYLAPATRDADGMVECSNAVFDYSWAGASGKKPVVCVHSIKAS